MNRRFLQWVCSRKRPILMWRGFLVALAGATLMLVRYQFDASSKWAQYQSKITDVLGDVGVVALIFLPLGIIILVDSVVYFAEKSDLRMPSRIAFALLTAFDRVVSTKAERFYEYRHQDDKDVFLAITQPEAQIKELLKQLYLVLRTATEDDDIKLVLARVSDGKLSGKLYNAPEDAIPSISDSDLNSGTFLSWVLSSGKATYITDLKKEKAHQQKHPKKKKHFLFLGEDDEERGGIAGFPVKRLRNRKTPIYVLSIRSEDCRIDKKYVARTKIIVEKFERRIQLENELDEIRRTKEATSE